MTTRAPVSVVRTTTFLLVAAILGASLLFPAVRGSADVRIARRAVNPPARATRPSFVRTGESSRMTALLVLSLLRSRNGR